MQSEIHTINKPLKTSPFDYNISREGSGADNHYYYEDEMNREKDLLQFAEIKLSFLVEAPDNLMASSSQLAERIEKSELEKDPAANLN